MVEPTVTDEGQVRERILGYLADRRLVESAGWAAVQSVVNGDGTPPSPEAEEQLARAFREFHARHLTSRARTRIGGPAFGSPSVVDDAHLTILGVSIKNDRATAETLEDEAPGLLPPTPYEYVLVREDGTWRLDNRRTPGDDRIGPKWIELLL